MVSGVTRRAFCLGLAASAAGLRPLRARAAPAQSSLLRIGLTPVFLDDQVAILRLWQGYLQERLQRPVELVQRGSYREIIQLVRQGQADVAWVCGYPYVRNRGVMRLLAVPLFRGEPLYRSYLIVSSADQESHSLADLRGRPFAYSDPDSNSGYLYPRYAVAQIGADPATFFGRSFFTWTHRKVVEAVGVRLAAGGAVDGYVWETLARFYPEVTIRSRVLGTSPAFGHPPFVARAALPEPDFVALRGVLLGMGADPAGARILDRLNLDGFTAGDDRLYDGIEAMWKALPGAHADADAA